MNLFDQDTAITHLGSGIYEAQLHDRWKVVLGPNGGYLMAIVLRAMQAEITAATGEPERSPRSLTLHYLAAPVAGTLRIDTRIERNGRNLSTITARFSQAERLIGIGIAAFGKPREGIEFNDWPAPEVTPVESLQDWDPFGGHGPVFLKNWQMRHALAVDESHARTGGWMRLVDTRSPDALSVAAMSDTWFPPLFMKTSRPLPAPTIDLTVHFRDDINTLNLATDSWVLGVFETRVAHQGYFEEDGCLWDEQGRLLAHSRQLAVCSEYKKG
ncbi:MAG: thioesterase family protein [Salinisphaeraceae bacterium]|nr:thioesterase family protein [Salinisphaeraceae bacterium]